MGRVLLTLALFGLLPAIARADDPVYTDPTTLVSTATTVFNTVTVLVVAMVGFYIIVRIVKGIRK